MRYIADLHIHSCYSRATSKASRLPGLAAWAAIKGIRVVATGDFTHPGWLQHLAENLEPAEKGLFKLRSWDNDEISSLIPSGIDLSQLALADIRFILSSEISSIYKKDGKVRKIHNILYAPDFDSVRRINKKLAGIGNLESDGRPILGLDAYDLLAIFLEMAPDGFFVPAHIWTPWFSLFGSKSGFDALEECYGDLSSEIFALETGLSSDPDMNRCISALDRYTLISNSDCHSPAKLGREANILDTDLSFPALRQALSNPVNQQGTRVFSGTIEFYPEEGKYHCDGHRKCHVCLEPAETIGSKGRCPVCGRPVTVGVLHRVMDLADRSAPVYGDNAPLVYSLIPLPEIVSELLGVGPASKTVLRSYSRIINTFGSEFNLLLDASIGDISHQGSPLLAEAVDRVRQGKVIRRPGYDGQFGVIRVFDEDEISRLAGQLELFGESPRIKKKKIQAIQPKKKIIRKKKEPLDKKHKLNSHQKVIVASAANHILVQAGPGTGKTHTLVARLLFQRRHKPGPATVITFTNKAAAEIRTRVPEAEKNNQYALMIVTLHSFCLHFLRLQDPLLRVAGPEMRQLLLRKLFPEKSLTRLMQISREISLLFANPVELSAKSNDFADSPKIVQQARRYSELVDSLHLIDLEAIIPCALTLLKKEGDIASSIRRQATFLYVDEFQDLNAVQYQLVLALARSSSIFAIGDPDQAIYGFRGADSQWFFSFIRDLNPEIHSLTVNYRCCTKIIQAANQVIAKNTNSGQAAVAHSKQPGLLYKKHCTTAYDEAWFVVRQIENLVGGTSHREIEKLASSTQNIFSLGEIGILYRTSRQADIISDVLFKQGIPCRRVDLEPFYLHNPVQPLYLWAVVAANLGNLADLLCLLAREQGIGKKTLSSVEEALAESPDVLMDFFSLAEKIDRLKRVRSVFQELSRQIYDVSRKKGVAAALVPVLEHYDLSSQDSEIQRFFRIAGAIGDTLEEFAGFLQDNTGQIVAEPYGEAVNLMTMHAAKGTEFSIVFLLGIEEGVLPLRPREQLSQTEFNAHIEEERRLFFVGMTRARYQLYLSWSDNEHGRGQFGRSGKASRFLSDIGPDLFSEPLPVPRRKKRCQQLTLFPLS